LPADTLDPVQQFAETSREPQLESVQSLFGNDRNMSIRRSKIEKALDELISNFEGIRFQRLAVVLAKQRFSDFVASEPMKDLGADVWRQLFFPVGTSNCRPSIPPLAMRMNGAPRMVLWWTAATPEVPSDHCFGGCNAERP
jgi:hypothetical protein